MLLGATAAFAQGYPLPHPVYGSVWTANKLHDEKMAAASDAGQAKSSQKVNPSVANQNADQRGSSGG